MDPFRSLDVMRRDVERMFSNFPSFYRIWMICFVCRASMCMKMTKK